MNQKKKAPWKMKNGKSENRNKEEEARKEKSTTTLKKKIELIC